MLGDFYVADRLQEINHSAMFGRHFQLFGKDYLKVNMAATYDSGGHARVS